MLRKKDGKRASFFLKMTCPECKIKFITNRKNKIYCKRSCMFKAWAKKHPRISHIPDMGNLNNIES